jgi:hypothetical protein
MLDGRRRILMRVFFFLSLTLLPMAWLLFKGHGRRHS